MEQHEWNERTDEGRHFYRANYHGKGWRIMIATKRRDPEWTILEEPTEAVWEALRDIVWRKYQRKRCPYERVQEIDKILGRESSES